jgi:enoyl-CoA hydratase/carnithine racemase
VRTSYSAPVPSSDRAPAEGPFRSVSVPPAALVPARGLVPLDAVVEDLAGTPAAIVVAGGEGAWDPLAALSGPAASLARRSLGEAPALTLGVGPVPDAWRDAFDLLAASPEEATALLAAASRAPLAVVAAAILLRTAPGGSFAGLVAESTTYSMLQAGPEFRRFLSTRRAPSAEQAEGPRVAVSRRGDVVEAVLDRPWRHNALDVAMRDELWGLLEGLRREPGVALLLAGNGPSFCSGGDLAEFGTGPGPAENHLVRIGRSLARACDELGPRTVAAVHGACLGAGLELAAFARVVVASEDARFGLPEAGLGLIPGAGGTVSLPRRVGRQRTLRLLVTGAPIPARTALAWGLVDDVVAGQDLLPRARILAAELAARAPQGRAAGHRATRAGSTGAASADAGRGLRDDEEADG